MLASLQAHPRPGVSNADAAQERVKARELFDRILKGIEIEETTRNNAPANGHGHAQGMSRSAKRIHEDMHMHAEVARLWQEGGDGSLERMCRALREALRISEGDGKADPRLLNNLGALCHLEGNMTEARELYERALTSTAGLGPDTGDVREGMSTTMLYNLARVYEDAGDDAMAKDAYGKLLARHPEYVDGEFFLLVDLVVYS